MAGCPQAPAAATCCHGAPPASVPRLLAASCLRLLGLRCTCTCVCAGIAVVVDATCLRHVSAADLEALLVLLKRCQRVAASDCMPQVRSEEGAVQLHRVAEGLGPGQAPVPAS